MSQLNPRIEGVVYEIKRHLHNHERWFGKAAVPNGEIHVADEMMPGIAPFEIVSGDNDFGDWTQLLGSEDTPFDPLSTDYYSHRIQIHSTDSVKQFTLQFIIGERADFAEKIAAKNYSAAPYIPLSNSLDSGLIDIMEEPVPKNTKLWCRLGCEDSDAKKILLYLGIYEYRAPTI